MAFNLRKRARISYFEPEEPSFDRYIYCDQCSDFVYDYCSVHGPLLVIPDNKVPLKTSLPSYIPRAALTIPDTFLHLAPSIIPGAGLGVFATLTLPRGVRFGPYRGQRSQDVDSMYCWQIFDDKNRRSHVIDAARGDLSNWMRYVNCARHYKEQNILAYQYRGELYYRTIKIIPRYTELLVFYGSEFANALNINLSQFNNDKYYKEIICKSINLMKSTEKSLQSQDYITEDQFHFIDAPIDNKNIPTLNKQNQAENFKQITSNKTETNNLECEHCKKTFKSKRSLRRHSLVHLCNKKYNCEFCYYKSNELYRYKKHVGKHTNTFEYSCEKCGFKTNYPVNFKKHCNRNCLSKMASKLKSNLTELACGLCDYKTMSRKNFTIHNCRHKGLRFECNDCDYSSYSKYNLGRHISRTHLKLKPSASRGLRN